MRKSAYTEEVHTHTHTCPTRLLGKIDHMLVFGVKQTGVDGSAERIVQLKSARAEGRHLSEAAQSRQADLCGRGEESIKERLHLMARYTAAEIRQCLTRLLAVQRESVFDDEQQGAHQRAARIARRSGGVHSHDGQRVIHYVGLAFKQRPYCRLHNRLRRKINNNIINKTATSTSIRAHLPKTRVSFHCKRHDSSSSLPPSLLSPTYH
jgi:hypothetical protein